MARRAFVAAGAALALVHALAAATAAATVQAGPAPAGTGAAAERVALDLSGPRPIAMLAIGEDAAVPVIFDTGASGNVIDAGFAREAGLPDLGPARVGTPAGAPIEGFRTSIASGRLGGVALADVGAVALPLPADLGVKGVFGAGSFSGRLLHLDLARGEIRITGREPATTPAGTAFPYSGGPGAPRLPGVTVEIGGRTFDGHIDTGNPGALTLPLELADQIALEAPMRAAARPARFADGVPRALYEARIRGTVRIGPLTFENPEVRFMDGLRRVNVGVQALRGVVVVLDPEQGRTWLVPAG